MKKLTKFETFKTEEFLKEKELVVTSVKYKKDEKFDGLSLTVLITRDGTNYDGLTGLNAYEKFIVKVVNGKEDMTNHLLHKKLRIHVNQNTKATVWGDYKQNLVITTDVNSIKTYE